MSKAAEAFRTISEVAGDLDIPKHVLRFWEAKFPQIRPMKRGGGRRYYRPEDMELLRGIRRLLHAEGYTIKGVQKILREMGIDHVKAYGSAPEPTAGAARAGTNAAALKRRKIKPAASSAEGRPGAAADTGTDLATTIQSAIRELQACRAILLGEPPAVTVVASPRTARARAVRS